MCVLRPVFVTNCFYWELKKATAGYIYRALNENAQLVLLIAFLLQLFSIYHTGEI